MKIKQLIALLLFSIMFCIEPDSNAKYIYFSNNGIKSSDEGVIISGTTAIIEKPGIYLVTGEAEEGNLVIKSNSQIYLENLNLSSEKTAPIIVDKDLKDVKIINLQNTVLTDLEDDDTTEGECAVIKVKKNSNVYFENYDIFKLNGECKNIIRGTSQVSLIFGKSDGDYIINARKTCISSDGLIEFRGGIFTIFSQNGDAIKSAPEDYDTESLGKILIKDGIFNIECYNDAFTAKNNIIIMKGRFNIKTQNGYNSEEFDENESSKGFKVTNSSIGSEIKIYSGDFYLNTADDAFRSNRDITILAGKFTIFTRDDAICAKYNLFLGKKHAPINDLNIKILYSYESLEGMKITIYSGKIIASSSNDGINASGVVKKTENTNRRNITWNDTNWNRWNDSNRNRWNNTNRNRRNNTNRNRWNDTERNRTEDDRPKNRQHHGTPGNSSYIISIYDGDIYVFSESDGIDSNGNVYIHGGNLTIFSKGSGSDEPIDHNGNLTIFNGEFLGVGSRGVDSIHGALNKGNQLYGFYSGFITENKILVIKNEKDEIVKEGTITRDINYIFYTSPKINENYRFFVYDERTDNKTELKITFEYPDKGEDDDDVNYNSYKNETNEIINEEEEEKNIEEEKNNNVTDTDDSSKFFKNLISTIIILFLF